MYDFTREQILAALNAHDKDAAVKITPEKIEEIKSNPLLKDAFASLEKCREFYRERPLYSIPFSLFKRFEEDGDRSEFEYAERGYFMHRGHLKTWALSVLFYGEKEDITLLEDTIWAICDEYTWSVAAHMSGKQGIYVHYQPDNFTIDLFAAETGQAIAEILQIVGDKLNPLVVQRAKRELKTRIIDRYLYGDLSDFSWSKSTNNWAAVCAGSVGMAAMCELDDNEKLAEFLEKTLISMRTFMSGFSDDGACLEGLGYWSYGFGYFSCFADMLYRRTGGEINLFDDEKTHLVALFPTKTFFYGSRTVSFSDGGSRSSLGLGRISILKKHYPDLVIPATANVGTGVELKGCHRFATTLRGFLWADTELPTSDDSLHIYPFPDAQWYVASGKNDFGFAAKAGTNNEPHNHNDIGHFIVYKKGVEFFADLGSGEYSKQYFRAERYTFPHCGSQGHSVPIIDGIYQSAGKEFVSKDVTVSNEGIKMDMAGAYKCEKLTSLIRDYKFDGENASVSLTDTYTFAEAPETLTERFLTRIVPTVSDGVVTLTSGELSVSLYFDANAFDVEVLPQDHKDHGGRPIRFYYIDLKVKAIEKNMEFKFEIK